MNFTKVVLHIIGNKAEANKKKIEDLVEQEEFWEATKLKVLQDGYIDLMKEIKKLL